MNSKLLDEITKRNYSLIQQKIGKFIIDEIEQRKAKGVVFGLSGGIDSAVVSALCAKYVREKTVVLILPFSKITPDSDTQDAIKLAKSLNLRYELIDIHSIHNEYSKYLKSNSLANGNLIARIRSNIVYHYANAENYLVLGPSDKSEFLIGYFTKFGDGAADLLPIVSLYKTQIRKLGQFLQLPADIISKPSGPHLWGGHTAQSELKLSYEEIDSILYCIFDKNLSMEETSMMTSIPISDVKRINELHKKSEHKRFLPKAYIL